MLTSALNNAVGEQDRKEILTELGEVLEQRMNEQEQGIAFYKRALDVDPHFVPALEKLERIYETRGQTQDLVDALVAKAKGQTQPEHIAATRLKARVENLDNAQSALMKDIARLSDELARSTAVLEAYMG